MIFSDSSFNTDPHELLTIYAFSRGFMSPKGLPDCSRAARSLVKDFINGKISCCESPPGVDQSNFNDWSIFENKSFTKNGDETSNQKSSFTETLKTLQKRNLVENEGGKVCRVDGAFFGAGSTGVHVKGKNKGYIYDEGKPPKKANKNIKKDKLRRIYRDLDA